MGIYSGFGFRIFGIGLGYFKKFGVGIFLWGSL